MPDNQNNQPQDNQTKSEKITEYLGLELKDVSGQIENEYKVAEKFMRSKRETWHKYL